MSATPPTTPGRSVEEIIGTELAFDASPSQRTRIEHAITQNPEGVRRVADKVKRDLVKGSINAGIPVLLARLDKGSHKRNSPKATADLSVIDFAERRYLALIAKYPDLGQQDAIEYAVDFTLIDQSSSMSSWQLEQALKERIA